MNKFEMFSLRNGGNLIIALTDPEGDGSNTRVLFVLFVLILLIVFLLIGLFLSIRSCIAYDKKVRQHIYRLVNSQISVTPDDFNTNYLMEKEFMSYITLHAIYIMLDKVFM